MVWEAEEEASQEDGGGFSGGRRFLGRPEVLLVEAEAQEVFKMRQETVEPKNLSEIC